MLGEFRVDIIETFNHERSTPLSPSIRVSISGTKAIRGRLERGSSYSVEDAWEMRREAWRRRRRSEDGRKSR